MIESIEELEAVRRACKSMVTKRASASALAAAAPVPGADVAADIAILMEMLPAINRKFGLSQDQVDNLDPQTKQQLAVILTSLGNSVIGKAVTKELVVTLLKKVGLRVATKSVVKFVPLLGTAIATSVSFGAMKWVGNSHIDDCYQAVKQILGKKAATRSPAEADKTVAQAAKSEASQSFY